MHQTSTHRSLATLALSTLMFIGGTGVYAAAEGQKYAPTEAFQTLDVNADSYVSRLEAARDKPLSAAFDAADANHDARLDASEFDKARAIQDRKAVSAYLDDSLVTARVKAALAFEDAVSMFGVSVETRKGVVLVSGFVDSDVQARHILGVVAGIEGVRSVQSNLRVGS